MMVKTFQYCNQKEYLKESGNTGKHAYIHALFGKAKKADVDLLNLTKYK